MGGKYLMTLIAVECGGHVFAPIDLMTKKPIRIEEKGDQYVGAFETVIENEAQIMEVMKKLERDRYTTGHK